MENPVGRHEVVNPERESWVLHPLGEDVPTHLAPDTVQVILLDGTWRQSAGMLSSVHSWGRKVRLPMAGPSRYQLRNQTEPGKYSTIEALIFLFAKLGLNEAELALRLQFELHVYAGLRTRGDQARIEQFLATSKLRDAMPDLLAKMDASRPDFISLAKTGKVSSLVAPE